MTAFTAGTLTRRPGPGHGNGRPGFGGRRQDGNRGRRSSRGGRHGPGARRLRGGDGGHP